jgi:hypothetical protein
VARRAPSTSRRLSLDEVAIALVDEHGAVLRGDASSGAVFSRDLRHRYLLWRRWGSLHPGARLFAVIGLNCSTADEQVLDPTVKRCATRASAAGYDGLVMLNLGSLRSTDPRGILEYVDSWHGGAANDSAIVHGARSADQIVAAWGGPYQPKALREAVEARANHVVNALARERVTLHAFALTKGGHPRHPLYLPYSAEPKTWLAAPRALRAPRYPVVSSDPCVYASRCEPLEPHGLAVAGPHDPSPV